MFLSGPSACQRRAYPLLSGYKAQELIEMEQSREIGCSLSAGSNSKPAVRSAWWRLSLGLGPLHVNDPGTYSGAVTIQNNDADEDPYDIVLSGTATN